MFRPWLLSAYVAFVSTAATIASAKPPAEQLPKYPPPAEVRAAFLKMLDRPKVAADPKNYEPPKFERGFIIEHLSIASEGKADGTIERVPMLLHSSRKISGADSRRDRAAWHGRQERWRAGMLEEFAKRGIIGIAIDARYHGERIPRRRTGRKNTSPRLRARGVQNRAKRRNIRSITTPVGICGERSIISLIGRTSIPIESA